MFMDDPGSEQPCHRARKRNGGDNVQMTTIPVMISSLSFPS
jgi:hypothetical protein